MTAPVDPGGAYQDVSEQQEQFRQAQRDAAGGRGREGWSL